MWYLDYVRVYIHNIHILDFLPKLFFSVDRISDCIKEKMKQRSNTDGQRPNIFSCQLYAQFSLPKTLEVLLTHAPDPPLIHAEIFHGLVQSNQADAVASRKEKRTVSLEKEKAS